MNRCVSFVVPALNEAKYIAAAIASIHDAMQHRQPDYEVIVVDDDSQDSTADIARQHRAHVLQVHQRNIAAVRNAGARQARGDFLIFVDADTRVSQALAQEALDAFQNGATWGTALAVPADPCPWWARLGVAAYSQFYVRFRK